jgi:predicted SnoaL-like aldol condensation-catalyzing enzyme
MLTVKLQGGLGNQLFQLGFLDYISKITGKEKYICELQSPLTLHSKNQYYETIFQEWKSLYKNIPASIIHENPHMIKQEWITHTENTCYIGYFQRYEYMDLIKDEFISKLKFNTSILEKYPEITNKIFIHIRGGDYLTIQYHNICNKEYYDKEHTKVCTIVICLA